MGRRTRAARRLGCYGCYGRCAGLRIVARALKPRVAQCREAAAAEEAEGEAAVVVEGSLAASGAPVDEPAVAWVQRLATVVAPMRSRQGCRRVVPH